MQNVITIRDKHQCVGQLVRNTGHPVDLICPINKQETVTNMLLHHSVEIIECFPVAVLFERPARTVRDNK